MPNPLEGDVRFGSFFYTDLWRGIMQQADIEDYSLLHYPASARYGDDHKVFLDGRVDGVLMDATSHGRTVRLTEAGMPTVLIEGTIEVPMGCGAVYADEWQIMVVALTHLCGLGHRRIAHIAGPLGDEPPGTIWSTAYVEQPAGVAQRRLEHYINWMTDHGVYDPLLVANENNWASPNAEVILRLWRALPDPPTAVLCANDAQAVDVAAAAKLIGWKIPDEISVMGIDNSSEAADCDPPITSVAVPLQDVGRESMKTVLRLIAGEPAELCRIAVPGASLVVRRSTARRVTNT